MAGLVPAIHGFPAIALQGCRYCEPKAKQSRMAASAWIASSLRASQ
jgi:hypothetical protein